MPFEVVLHIGAHRTGTTTLQAALDDASAELAEFGIVALTPPRAEKRGQISIRKLATLAGKVRRPLGKALIWYYRRQATALMDGILRSQSVDLSKTRRLILSEERILGSIFDRKGHSIYPVARSQLSAFHALLPYPVDEVHLTIRSYERFITSAYAMRSVFGRGIKPYESIRANLETVENTWTGLIAEIQSAFPQARLVVSIFEEASFEERFKSLAGNQAVNIKFGGFITKAKNQSPTLEAIEFVRQSGTKPRNPDEIVARFANGTPFDPSSAETKSRLRKRYLTEVAQLRQRADIIFL